jgi:hypothetical protein
LVLPVLVRRLVVQRLEPEFLLVRRQVVQQQAVQRLEQELRVPVVLRESPVREPLRVQEAPLPPRVHL